jgi:PST family polysaccharide transporter
MSNSFKDIAKSTGVIGLVQFIKLLFGLLRNKIIAIFFGAFGVGVWGLYLSFVEMIQGASSLGLEKSSVKQIAENSSNLYKRNLTIQIATYSLTLFSVIGALVTAFFSEKFSQNIFGTKDYANGILVCCLVIFVNALTNIFHSILNGLREIKKLALSQFYGVLVGNSIVFVLIAFLKTKQIPLFILILSISTFLPSLIYLKKLRISFHKVVFKDIFQSFSILMRIGFGFWVSLVFMTIMTYLTKLYLQEKFNVNVVGIYQASWTISNLYVGLILTSMGVDFFPKICQVISNQSKGINLINEQIEFGLLVSFPFIIGILIFAPFLLTLLYSSEFTQGSSIIRWQMLGVTIRLLGFPFGYALMAKEKVLQYTISQFVFSGLNYLFVVLLVACFGFKALGLNYFAAYLIYILMVGGFCVKEFKFRFSAYLLKLLILIFCALSCAGGLIYYFDGFWLYFLGSIITILVSYYSFRQLKKKLNINVITYIKRKLLK